VKLKLVADEDLNQMIVNGARLSQPAIDFLTAREGSLIHLPDEVVLKVAAGSGRVLVTHDRNTMLTCFASFIQSQSSPGLIVVSQNLAVGAALEQLALVCECMDAEELTSARLFIPM
jgi:hypothetical protein